MINYAYLKHDIGSLLMDAYSHETISTVKIMDVSITFQIIGKLKFFLF